MYPKPGVAPVDLVFLGYVRFDRQGNALLRIRVPNLAPGSYATSGVRSCNRINLPPPFATTRSAGMQDVTLRLLATGQEGRHPGRILVFVRRFVALIALTGALAAPPGD